MNNKPLTVFTGLAAVAAIVLGALIYSRMPGPEPAKPPASATNEPATAEKTPEVAANKPAETAPAQPEVKPEQAPATTVVQGEQAKPAETAPAQPAAKSEQSAALDQQAKPTTEQQPAQQPEQPAAQAQPAKPAKTPAAAKPTFDTVRVEPEGDTLAAGQAVPGAEVTLKRNGEPIGKAVANEDGDWVVVTEAPLPKGPSELSIEQKASSSGPVVMSDQSVAVVVPETSGTQVMIALVEPGKPTQVLQKGTSTAESQKTEAASDSNTAAGEQPAASGIKPAETTVAETAPKTEIDTTTKSDEQAAVSTKPAAQPEAETSPQPVAKAPPEAPAVETPAAQSPAPVSLDAVDYNAAGDIVFSGTSNPGTTVRVYVDNKATGDARADASGKWIFAGTQQVPPGGHSLRIDQIDADGKVKSRVELPFVREEPTRVAEIMQPDATVAPQPAKPPEPAASESKPSTTTEVTVPETKSAVTPQTTTPEVKLPAVVEVTKPETKVTTAEATSSGTSLPAAEETKSETQPATTPQPAASEAKPEVAATQPSQPAAKTDKTPDAGETVAEAGEQAQTMAQPEPAAQPAPVVQESEANATTVTTQSGEAMAEKKGRVIIQPGNNLWKLSRVIYGKGISYTVIYEANRDQIRDPDLIYPGQIFATPHAVPPETIDPKRHKPLSAEEGGTSLQ